MSFGKKEYALLHALAKNCRATSAVLAKQSGYVPTMVSKKIAELEDKGVIVGYRTHINPAVFGYALYRLAFTFQHLQLAEFKQITTFLAERKNILRLQSMDSNFGLVMYYYAHSYADLEGFLLQCKERFSKFIATHTISKLHVMEEYPPAYLLDTAIDEGKQIAEPKQRTFALDHKDRRLLRILVRDARSSIIALHRKTKIPARTIQYRLRQLQQKGVIMGYHAIIDKSLINIHQFRLHLSVHVSASEVKRFARSHPSIVGYEEISPYDYTLLVETKNLQSLMHIVASIQERFSPLQSYSFDYVVEDIKSSVFESF